jgi:hypothetical protein
MTFAQIKQNLDLSDADFKELKLCSARIEGELRLGKSDRPSGSRLVLSNAYARTVQDWWDEEAWKNKIENKDNKKKKEEEILEKEMPTRDAWPK